MLARSNAPSPPHCCTNMHSEQPRGPASESPHSPSAPDHSTVQFVAVHKNWASLIKTLRQACDSICSSLHMPCRVRSSLFLFLVHGRVDHRRLTSVSPDRIMPDRKDITVHPDAVSYDGRRDRCLRSIDRHVFQCMPRSRASCNSCTAASRLNLRGRTPYPKPDSVSQPMLGLCLASTTHHICPKSGPQRSNPFVGG